MTERFCRDCVHVARGGGGRVAENAPCSHAASARPDELHVVTGRVPGERRRTAWWMRQADRPCGPEAVLFEGSVEMATSKRPEGDF